MIRGAQSVASDYDDQMLGYLLALSSFCVVATTLGNSKMAGLNFSCRSQTLVMISVAIDAWGEDGIQQGGVRYRAVSHCRTRMLLGSPIRCCAIVNEKGLRARDEMWGVGLDGQARRSRDVNMVLDQAFSRWRDLGSGDA
jgi:hypothetical protein